MKKVYLIIAPIFISIVIAVVFISQVRYFDGNNVPLFYIPKDPGHAPNCTDGNIKIWIRNSIHGRALTDDDFDIHLHIPPDYNPKTNTIPLQDIELEPDETGLLVDYNCGGSCEDGYHTVILGTGTYIREVSLLCFANN